MTQYRRRRARFPSDEARRAAALKYDATKDTAPQIVGIGTGFVAESIIKTARESGVPVVEDDKASRELLRLGLGQEIPPELYDIIAEILVFVASLDEGKGKYSAYAPSAPPDGNAGNNVSST